MPCKQLVGKIKSGIPDVDAQYGRRPRDLYDGPQGCNALVLILLNIVGTPQSSEARGKRDEDAGRISWEVKVRYRGRVCFACFRRPTREL